jgi:alpha-beta hydrolase superfamily lysophospholipase
MSSRTQPRIPRRLALTGLFGLAACAPTVRGLQVPPPGFSGPRLEPRALIAVDGARLPMDVWMPAEEPWAVLVALHGMNDYANAFSLGGPWWAERGVATYAYDQRGFGRAEARGIWPGPEALAEDLRTAVALVRQRHPKAKVVVLGHSMGGAVAIHAFASERPPVADRLILAAPAVWGWSRQALPNRLVLWVAAHTAPKSKLTAPDWLVRKVQASDNIDVLISMSRDPNMIFKTRIDAVYGLVGLMQLADKALKAVKAPVLYLYGAHDKIIPASATRHAVRGLKPSDRFAYYPNGYHLLNRDRAASIVWADILAYLKDPDAPLPSGAPASLP